MIRLLAGSAAAFITLAAALAPAASACDEDCVYEAHEAASERAYERASAREEAAEEGYYSPEGRRSSGSSSRKRRRPGQQKPPLNPLKAAAPSPSPSIRRLVPRAAHRALRSPPRIPRFRADPAPVKPPEDDTHDQPAKAVGCKKYIASAGVTLSVPCE